MSDEPVVVKETVKPCGCVTAEMSEGPAQTMPCFGHGLIEVALGLRHSASALTAMGNRGVAEAQQAALNKVAENMQKKGPQGIVQP